METSLIVNVQCEKIFLGVKCDKMLVSDNTGLIEISIFSEIQRYGCNEVPKASYSSHFYVNERFTINAINIQVLVI